MSEVTCARCGATVDDSETTYNENGDLLCRRCGDLHDVNVQVERARQEAIAKAQQSRSHRGGLLGLAIELATTSARVADAEQEHQSLVAEVEANLAHADPTGLVLCGRCGGQVMRAEAVPQAAGKPLCPSCAAGGQMARANDSGSLVAGLLLGLFGLAIGVGLAIYIGRRRTILGGLIGCGITMLILVLLKYGLVPM